MVQNKQLSGGLESHEEIGYVQQCIGARRAMRLDAQSNVVVVGLNVDL